ncbi:hypothetical protein LZ31DRAFT_380039 [Colletotrichum somersetense]|nr:hypothetical protein LZ31DRAFT_380039 [Colletotrichum somersetense]
MVSWFLPFFLPRSIPQSRTYHPLPAESLNSRLKGQGWPSGRRVVHVCHLTHSNSSLSLSLSLSLSRGEVFGLSCTDCVLQNAVHRCIVSSTGFAVIAIRSRH